MTAIREACATARAPGSSGNTFSHSISTATVFRSRRPTSSRVQRCATSTRPVLFRALRKRTISSNGLTPARSSSPAKAKRLTKTAASISSAATGPVCVPASASSETPAPLTPAWKSGMRLKTNGSPSVRTSQDSSTPGHGISPRTGSQRRQSTRRRSSIRCVSTSAAPAESPRLTSISTTARTTALRASRQTSRRKDTLTASSASSESLSSTPSPTTHAQRPSSARSAI